MEVGGVGAGMGGEGVVKPSRVPLGVVLATAMPHKSQPISCTLGAAWAQASVVAQPRHHSQTEMCADEAHLLLLEWPGRDHCCCCS